jgi:hypothetical protein
VNELLLAAFELLDSTNGELRDLADFDDTVKDDLPYCAARAQMVTAQALTGLLGVALARLGFESFDELDQMRRDHHAKRRAEYELWERREREKGTAA